MLAKRIAVLLFLALCYSSVSADIRLKKSFFSGWKYSLDGLTYQKVGFSGKKLFNEMADNKNAQSHMLKYKSAKTWYAITGWPGGFLLGWPLGGYLGSGGEWKDSYTTMVLIGAPLTIMSYVFDAKATRNLKKAVKIYNGEESSLGFDLNLKYAVGQNSTGLVFGLKYEF